jgi:hypothetical protein
MSVSNHDRVWTGLLWGLVLALCMWTVALGLAAAVGVLLA